ncbi:glucose-methanol-choline oxidoreductase-like protein [Xylaria sp. FL0933]|nr:glucose-methanol-choline oxidoreductase-like protein [Xylaria sp. FL0933]
MDSGRDFVIVGGGLSGLVLAARLTEDPNITVTVIEAGGDHTADPRIRTPALWLSVLGTPDFDWSYHSTPQKGLNGKVIPLSQGKLLGGSSAINGQAFVSNSKAVVDAWGEFGNPGWNWETLSPYYKKFHTLTRPSTETVSHLRLDYIDENLRSKDGPVQASFPDVLDDPIPAAWVDTLAALGHPASGDPLSGQFTGGYINPMTIDPSTRTRSDAATAYLEPVKARKNLQVITNAMAEKLIFDTTGVEPRVTGVQIRKDGDSILVKASKEVVLSAGVFGSPKLLELSGIGSRERLEKLSIPIVVDNPNVGENLQDHPNAGISFEVADGVKTLDGISRQEPDAIAAAMNEYMTEKTGPLAIGGNFVGSLLPVPHFVHAPNSEATLEEVLNTATDTTPGPFSPHHAAFVRSILAKRNEGPGNLFAYAALSNFVPEDAGADIVQKVGTVGNFLTICAAILHPLSRGSVHIKSSDPSEKPTIDPRYLEHPVDLDVLARYFRYIDQIVQAEPLNKYLKPNGRRSNGAPVNMNDLAEVKEYVKKAALSCWHPTSTCAMLPLDKGGVVDPSLKVYGVANLRVVDSSILPIVTRGNPQTTVYAVAERAADIIRASAAGDMDIVP